MANNHYISRFLTAPWKKKGTPLWHFDFETGRFSEKLSLDRLFAKRNLWSDELEVLLNKNTENFSTRSREKLIKTRGQPDSAEFRSLFLLILFQAARSGYMKGLGTDLEEITAYSGNQLDQLVLIAQQSWSLCGIHLPSEYRLFFPDNGIFLFPIQTQTEFKWIFSLPMEGTFCLALVPADLDSKTLENQIDYSHLVAWSVCSSKSCRRVVIHPGLFHYKKSPDLLANELIRMRSFVDSQIKLINQLNGHLNKMQNILSEIFN